MQIYQINIKQKEIRKDKMNVQIMILIIWFIALLLVLLSTIYPACYQSLLLKIQTTRPLQFFMKSDQQIASNDKKCQYHILNQQKCDICKNWFSSVCKRRDCIDICSNCSTLDQIHFHLPNGEYVTYYRRKPDNQPLQSSSGLLIAQIDENKTKLQNRTGDQQKNKEQKNDSEKGNELEKSPAIGQMGIQHKPIKLEKKNTSINKIEIRNTPFSTSNLKKVNHKKHSSILSFFKNEKNNKPQSCLSTCSIQNPTNEWKNRKKQGFQQIRLKKQKDLRDKIQNYLRKNHPNSTERLIKTSAIYDILIKQVLYPEFLEKKKKIEPFQADFTDLDVKCYLSMFNWAIVTKVIFVDVRITDEQFKQTLDFLGEKKVTNFFIRSQTISLQSTKYAIEEIKNFKYLEQIVILLCVMKIKEEEKKHICQILLQSKLENYKKTIKFG